jgi:hypothetical protein
MATYDVSQYKHLGKASIADYYVAASDPDIVIVIPLPGSVDTPQSARESADFMYKFAREVGKKSGVLVVMSNILSQDAETRRVYAEMDNSLFFGTVLVVDNPLSRALGSFFIGLSRPRTPVKLSDSLEKGMAVLRAMRSE